MTFDLDDARSRVSDLERADAAELKELVKGLAQPRATGSEGASAVETEIREGFESLGYQTRPLPFEISTWPGRFGLVVAGLALLVTGGLAGWFLYSGLPIPALVTTLAGTGVALLPLLLLGPASRRLPFGRVETTNLLFRRPEGRPSWILMAHRDTKSQLVPTLLRTVALVLAATALIVLLLIGAIWFAGDPYRFPTAGLVAGVVLAATGLLMALSWSGNRSPGALDNASGVAALLAVARRVSDRQDIAFLITEGEELGLAGARAAVGSLPPVQGVINVDSLDDGGGFLVAEGHGWKQRGSAPQLAAALLTAAGALNLEIERRPLPRTIPVDHMPLAAAGIPSVSLLKGGYGSLMRIHRPADSPDRLRCEGAAEGVNLLTAALRLLEHDPASHLAVDRAVGS